MIDCYHFKVLRVAGVLRCLACDAPVYNKPAEFVQRNPERPESRHNPSPSLASIIRREREDARTGKLPRSINSDRAQRMALAAWRRGVEVCPISDTVLAGHVYSPGRLSRAWPGEPQRAARSLADRRPYPDSVWNLKLSQVYSGLDMPEFLRVARYDRSVRYAYNLRRRLPI